MQMKIAHTIIAFLSVVFLAGACKKTTQASPEFAHAYTRFIVVDGPGSGKVQFYLDGKVNANGDSVVLNPDGSVYAPDPAQPTTSTINYPSGGWTDNQDVSFAGTFGYFNTPGSGYSCFPNPTDRIALAPAIGGINYFSWASIPARRHQLSFNSVISASLYGNQIYVKGNEILNQSIDLEGGAIQTFLLVNKGDCKSYHTSGVNTETGLPMYTVNEQINFFTNRFDVLSVKDHPENLPKFSDSSAYLRFLNVTPTYSDQAMNVNSDSIDLYLAPIFGYTPDIWTNYKGYIKRIDSVGAEFLVAKGLSRFKSSVDAPFYELNLAAAMRRNSAGQTDTAIAPGQPRIPRYYRVLAYRSGQSAVNGNFPLGQGDWLAVYNEFIAHAAYDDTPLGYKLDSWLLRSDGTYLHPAICTIPVAIGLDPVPESGATNYLGFRSCINYIPAGINAVFTK